LAAAKIGYWTGADGTETGLWKTLKALAGGGNDVNRVMAIAYAMALHPRDEAQSEILAQFPEPMRAHALRAIKSARGEHDVMVDIPAGSFMMGTPEAEAVVRAELPQHDVNVPGLKIGKFAVTFAEYDAFCDATGRDRPGDQDWGREDRPVINVSWDDAQDYCDWLYAFTGERYRLPSEAEWEYACRAGTITPFSFGETISTDQANYDGNYTYGAGVKGEYRQRTVPVGSLPANPFGVHEMHGNVWEWCGDAWNWSYRQTLDRDTERPDDGAPWLTGDQSQRVLRGGSWLDDPWNLRSAIRYGYFTDIRFNVIGFRLARTL
jgi:formylglycine-generating enzyme required for sulfatase activity